LVSEERRPRTATALATSALLHVFLAALVLRGVAGRRTVESRAQEPLAPIEVALAEGRGAEPTVAGTAPPPPSRAARPPSARSPHVAPTPVLPAMRALPVTPAGPSATPFPGPHPARPIDLSFDALAADAQARATAESDRPADLAWLFGPAPIGDGRRRPLAELRAEAERRAGAEKNVRDGRADPFLFDVLRGAEKRLTPEATRIAERLPLGPSETMSAWARGYLGAVADTQHGLLAPPKAPDEAPGGPRPDLLGGYGEAQRQAEAGAEARTAEVCVAVAPGHAPVVTLRRSSGNAALDRLATDSFSAAGVDRPVASDIPPTLACYRVRVSATRMPPLPAVSVDLVHGRVIYPLKRMTKVTVELESVDFGPKQRPPSLLHVP
jgi:hypothetical protein